MSLGPHVLRRYTDLHSEETVSSDQHQLPQFPRGSVLFPRYLSCTEKNTSNNTEEKIPVNDEKQHHKSAADPILRRLQLRFPSRHTHTRFVPNEKKRDCETSLAKLQQETAGILTRHLTSPLSMPPITERYKSAYDRRLPRVTITTTNSGQYHRQIGPEEIHDKLHKGCINAQTILSRRQEMAKSTTSQAIQQQQLPQSAITTRKLQQYIEHMNPPFVNRILQAKMRDRPRAQLDEAGCQLIPVTQSFTRKMENRLTPKSPDKQSASHLFSEDRVDDIVAPSVPRGRVVYDARDRAVIAWLLDGARASRSAETPPAFSALDAVLSARRERAERPSGGSASRAAVYLLAEAIDRALREPPGALAALADGARGFPTAVRGAAGAPPRPGEDDAERGAAAVQHVAGVVDAGLAQTARQASATCAERGAILDTLRLVARDVAASCVRVIHHCRNTARRDATATRRLADAAAQDRMELHALRKEAQQLADEIGELRQVNTRLRTHAEEYEARVARLVSSDACFSQRSPEEQFHRLLKEEELSISARDKQQRDAVKGNQQCTNQENITPPVAVEDWSDAAQKQSAMRELYEESYRLLAAMSTAMASADVLCRPLYNHVTLPSPIASSNIAATRLAAVAQRVGKAERVNIHRRRVFDVFDRWIALHAHSASDAKTKRKEMSVTANTCDETTVCSGEVSQRSHCTMSSAGNEPRIYCAPKQRVLCKSVRYVTEEDLRSMNATDCTPDEVNALLKPGVDISDYIQDAWPPRSEPVMQMHNMSHLLHEVAEVLQHFVLRMRTLRECGMMQRVIRGPLLPPKEPENPCVLCGRCDVRVLETQRRFERVEDVVLGIEARYKLALRASQRAESEREEGRRQLQRRWRDSKKQMADRLAREQKLLRTHAQLMEENRQLTLRVFSDMTNTTDRAASGGVSLNYSSSNTSPPKSADRATRFPPSN